VAWEVLDDFSFLLLAEISFAKQKVVRDAQPMRQFSVLQAVP
jgi:hypothetical protein